MATRKSEATLTEEFREESVTLRGTTYRFREISGTTYEEIIKMAQGEDGEADLATVLKLMIPESLVSPKLSTEQIYAKPLPVLTAIQGVVNRMHFRDEPQETPAEEDDEPKNESEAPSS